MPNLNSTRACKSSAKSVGKNKVLANPQTQKKVDLTRLDLRDTEQAAHYINVSKSFLEKRRDPGSDGPKFLKIGSRVYYKREDLDQWLLARTHAPQGGADV